VDTRAGLDDVEKRKFFTVSRLELRTFGRPARSQSVYRLRYPGSFKHYRGITKLSCMFFIFVGVPRIFSTISLSNMAGALNVLTSGLEIIGLNLCRDVDYPEVFVVFLRASRKMTR
jgi:hypothetical protein